MWQKEDLIQKLHQAINIMICEEKTARSYGTEHKLTYSDICLLKCIQRNEHARAGEISRYLGITNGAVAQLSKKLENKGYLRPYRAAGNKKEVYYRLTASGQTACAGYDEHHRNLNAHIEAYIQTLDNDTTDKIAGLFETIVESVTMDKCCSIKRTKGKEGNNGVQIDGRCEKCKRSY